jgi:hypothetical protein
VVHDGGAALDGGAEDGGIAEDGGATHDGGVVQDGGSAEDGGAAQDGGTAEDGGAAQDGGTAEDGGAAQDGGTAEDGGTVHDGGVAQDGGVSQDGGTAEDGGAMQDGGLAEDGGLAQDGGTALDGGSPDELRIELTWDTDGTDLDLHVIQPPSPWSDWFTANDCYGASCPWLNADVTNGRGPEIFRITNPDAGTYAVGVHYYCDDSKGPSQALVRVYCGSKVVEYGPKELAPRTLWRVATVSWPTCDMEALVVTEETAIGCYQGPAACLLDGGCPSATCAEFSGSYQACLDCAVLPLGPYPTTVSRVGKTCEFVSETQIPDGGTYCGAACLDAQGDLSTEIGTPFGTLQCTGTFADGGATLSCPSPLLPGTTCTGTLAPAGATSCP